MISANTKKLIHTDMAALLSRRRSSAAPGLGSKPLQKTTEDSMWTY